MSRIFLTIDETDPNYPIAEIRVNGQILRMSDRELGILVEEIKWAQGAISTARAIRWQNLAAKYGGQNG